MDSSSNRVVVYPEIRYYGCYRLHLAKIIDYFVVRANMGRFGLPYLHTDLYTPDSQSTVINFALLFDVFMLHW